MAMHGLALSLVLAACISEQATALVVEQRDEVSFPRGPYNLAQYERHNDAYRYSAAWHFHHGKQHDVLQLTPFFDHEHADREFDAEVRRAVIGKTLRIEPEMQLYGPHVGQMAWKVYRAINWTHVHHEETYDILAYQGIPWGAKKAWTDHAVWRYLLDNPDVARSCAPLDVTMRRAAVMMKPYFTYYRNYYPRSNNLAWVAHWWHPAIYEAMMIGGNGPAQDQMVDATDAVMISQVLDHPPKRMLLSREMMPRYSRMSPESANIFDNLHMLHGIVFDILAYPDWTPDQKQAELYRFIDAMKYQPGDERLARKFTTPRPNVDPRNYETWMQGTDGEMTRIMLEMLDEMMPSMYPNGMSPQMKSRVMAQVEMKMTAGMQDGEIDGSLHDALMKLMPDMKMMPGSMEPGATPHAMVDAMTAGWRAKHGSMPDAEPWPMQ